jgi:hypothetical protein
MGYHYTRKGYIFTNFINKFFELKNNPDTVYRAIGKMILNSAYGYLGLNFPDQNNSIVLEENKLRILPVVEIEKNQPYDVKTSVAIAAIIAAESRMAVLDARINERTAYTDTDCLFLIGEGPLPGMDVDDTKLGS